MLLGSKREIWAKGNLKAKTGKSGKREFKTNLKVKREKSPKGNLKAKTRNWGKSAYKALSN